jgi:hypothetical protein
MSTELAGKRYRRLYLCFGLCCALGCSSSAWSAEIYRWVDESGTINYTQHKPIGVDFTQLTTAGRPVHVSRRSADAKAGVEDPAKDKLSKAEQALLDDRKARQEERQAEIARIRDANCSKSRRMLTRLTATERIRIRENNGDERVMTEDERQQRISNTQQNIVDNCASA